MNRAETLDLAKQYVTQDRAADHGDVEDTFGRTARYWTLYKGVPFDATEVAMMMALLKVARQQSNREHPDNYVDGCGYLAIAGELAAGDR